MAGSYDYLQEILSAFLAVAASYVVLDLAERVTAAPGRTRLTWITGGAMAMGIGIWAPLRVAILAFNLPVPVSYHWPTSLVSLLAAILSSAFALYLVSQPKMRPVQFAFGTVVMGGGIVAMDYAALSAIRAAAEWRFSPILIALSIALAIVFSMTTLLLAFNLREENRGTVPRKLGGAVVMAAAVLAMHYAARAALSFAPSAMLLDLSHTVSISGMGPLGVGIALVTLVILGMAALACQLDRVLAAQAAVLERSVVERTSELTSANDKLERSEAEANARAEELTSILDAVPGMVFISRDPACHTITGSRLTYDSLRLPYGTNVSKSAPEGSQHVSNFRVMRDGRELSAADLPMQQAAATGQEVRESETTWVFDDGTSRDTFGNAVPLRDQQGEIQGAVGVFVDITARNLAQAALRESEDRYRDLVEHSEDLVCTHDLAGKLLSCNPAPARILGYEVAELLDIPMQELMAPEFREQFESYLARVKTTGADKGLMAVITRTGDRRIWEYQNTLRTEGVPSPIVRGIAHDVTERMRAEKSLQRFRMLMDQSNDAIEVVNPETLRFIYINERACLDLGYSREELLSMSVYDINPNIDESMHARVIDRLRTSGSIILESRHRRKDGSTFPVEVSIKQVNLGRTYIVNVTRDITERKRTELALQEAQSELARVTRFAAMGELTASIAHEVNQPLAAVVTDASAALHWLAVQPPNLDEARESMSRTIQEANRAGDVIKKIRGLLRKVPFRLQPLDGNEVVRETLLLAEAELLRGGIIVQKELADDIPTALGDRVAVQQVVLNLILNAIDAMSTITDRRELFLKSSKHTDGILIQIQDSGKGFDLEQADRLFEPFFTTKPSGIGLGLSISSSIIEAHGGRLWAEPGASQGAIFQFTLPGIEGTV
jgi:PAS domain S-box-containing protein